MSSFIQRDESDEDFTVIPNSTLQDPNLSWSAKGLLCFMVSNRKDWKIHVWHLAKIYKGDERGNSRDAVKRMLMELREQGYVKYEMTRGSDGKWVHNYYVSRVKKYEIQKKIPETVKPATVKPATVKPSIITKTKLTKTKLTTTGATPQTPVVVVPSYIEEIQDLSKSEKQSLSRYPEDRVKLAIEFNKMVKPKESKIQQMIWHCKQEEPPKPNASNKKVDLYEKCKVYAKTHESEECEMYVTDYEVSFVQKVGNGLPKKIKFSDENASKIISDLVKKNKFIKTRNKS